MKPTLMVRADLGLGRGKIAAKTTHAAVAAALANLDPPHLRAWLRTPAGEADRAGNGDQR
jgi:peptidyl-tRNA hydrolase